MFFRQTFYLLIFLTVILNGKNIDMLDDKNSTSRKDDVVKFSVELGVKSDFWSPGIDGNVLEYQTEGLKPISPCSAVLMMDGDSLGKNMSDINKQDVITKGLADFTQKVPDITTENNGFLIYAGGDDVLAILPLEDAIPCATALRKHYNQCFKDTDLQTSLSGAIEFVHVKTSLTKILKDAHQLLDDIAKEKTGRDALAIRIWKPGGLQAQWAQPWEVALFDTPDGSQKTYLEVLADNFQKNDQEDDQFSNKFFFKIRERFDLLNPQNCDQKDDNGVFNDDDNQAIALMAMEYLNSGTSNLSQIKATQERVEKAKDTIRPLLKQCRPVTREADKKRKQWQVSPCLKVDAALLVRFLAHKGIER